MPPPRARLTPQRVVDAAVALADRDGLPAMTMRRLGGELGVEAMSLYKHVADKDDLLSRMIDRVYEEIELPATRDWRAFMRQRALSIRGVLAQHPWANGLMAASTSPGPSTLRHHDAVIGCLRRAGMSMPLVAHAFSAVDAYVYGFALQERSLPVRSGERTQQAVERMNAQVPLTDYPDLAAFSTEHLMQPDYDYGDEYLYGLGLVLDGLERARRRRGRER
jgi:AcrR family transcriptional regulator